ncbi:2-amino-4-ketopentanoate thiolase [Candidatus Bipolaricaulota bacterium]|nr:2-amino-4-ketopentanoate thiolase [Candidatus Bipolaricaulota bacterium]
MKGRKGDWVQIYKVLLQPEQRSPHIPEDTKQVPLELRVKGFLTHDAKINDEVTIVSLAGRILSGKLVAIAPQYGHDFGTPIPELLSIGDELRMLLWQGEER